MILWERDSRREPRGGQALGSRPSVRRLLPGTHPEPALGSAAGGGHLLRGEGAGGSMHGLLRVLLCGALWTQRPAARALSGCLRWFSDPPAISTLHTHTASAQTSSRTENS